MKLQKWSQIWLENYVQPTVKSKTYEHYKYLLSNHIYGQIGEMDMTEVSTIELQSFVSGLIRKGNKKTGCGLASSTVNTAISILKSMFKTAELAEVVKQDVASKIKRPQKIEKKVECFSFGEQKIIEKAVFAHKKPKMIGVVLCLYTGLRIGELLALEWADIDFKKNLLSVNKTCRDNKQKGGQKHIVNSPKTSTSKRVIPLPKQLIPILKKHKATIKNKTVISEDGAPVGVRSYQRSFELLLKKIKVGRKGFHALRHTFATRAIECGMDVKSLSEILGHKNSTVTLDLYVHSLMEHKKEMMNKIGKNLQ